MSAQQQQQQPDSASAQVAYRVIRIFFGMLLVLFGVFYEQIIFYRNMAFRTFLVLAGAALICWGVAFLVPRSWRLSRFRWFRRISRDRFRTPPEVLAYLAIMIILATGSMLGHSNTLLLVFGMMAGPFLLNGWVVYAMLRRLKVERSAPERVGAGETFTVDLTVHNGRRYLSSRLMRAEDQISNTHEELSGRVLYFRIPAKESRTGAYRVRLMQRGRYKLGPTLVSSRFPFGLGERGRYFETPDEVLVHPPVGELAPAWWRRVMGEDRIVNEQRARSGVFEDDFRQIREYRPGDAIRSIHWRTSARMNELMVKEFHENREHDAVVLVDLFDVADDREFINELAASFTATICHELARSLRDANVGFFLSGSENVAVTGKSSHDVWNQVLDSLAVCELSPKADTTWLAEQAAAFRQEGLEPILITTRPVEQQLDFGTATSAAALRAAHVVHVNREELQDIFHLTAEASPNSEPQPQEVSA